MTGRSVRLDILRALAVLLVLVRHLDLPKQRPSWVLYPVLETWQRGGWIGVDFFFVLSGFLVSGLLFREYQRDQRVRPGRFLLRRGLKIYPAFWVFMLGTALIVPDHVNRGVVLIELAFVQNYRPGIWGHTWSLAVEEHFYLLTALSVSWLASRPSRDPFASVPRIIGAVCFVVLVMRIETVLLWPDQAWFRYVIPTHLRIDALACGVGLSYAYHFHRQALLVWVVRHRRALIAAGVVLVVPAFVWDYEHDVGLFAVGFTGIYLGAAALLLAWLPASEPTNRFAEAVAYLGSHSYSTYLWHQAVNVLARPIAPAHWGLYAVVYFLGSIVVGIAMAALIEFPVLRLRDRYWPDTVPRVQNAALAV